MGNDNEQINWSADLIFLLLILGRHVKLTLFHTKGSFRFTRTLENPIPHMIINWMIISGTP